MTITLPNGCKVTPESIERALDMHKAAGLIRDWHNWHEASPRRARPLYTVVLARTGHSVKAELRDLVTLHEAHAFICGLVSAGDARPATRMPASVVTDRAPGGLPVLAAIPLGSGTRYACVVAMPGVYPGPDGTGYTALIARRDGLAWRADVNEATSRTFPELREALTDMAELAGLPT